MTNEVHKAGEELQNRSSPVVDVLRQLNIFSPNQATAYRESFADAARILGPLIETKLVRWTRTWATSGGPGAVVLTGNAGTGKTAAAEAYCDAVGADLPSTDSLIEVASEKWISKDLSGQSSINQRRASLRAAERATSNGHQVLLCVNEGVLRDGIRDDPTNLTTLATTVDKALREGAATEGGLTVINVNRQRITSEDLWNRLCDYLTRAELWSACAGCPGEVGCPMTANAQAVQKADVRNQLRTLVQLASGEAVPTMREVLGILAYGLVGGLSCETVKRDWSERDRMSWNGRSGYYHLLLGGGLPASLTERSPMMTGLRRTGLGRVSDLQVDGWLRDNGGAPPAVQKLAARPALHDESYDPSGLAESVSVLDRIQTGLGNLTFHSLGEVVSTSEDPERVQAGLDALVVEENDAMSAQGLWRSRIFFEAPGGLGDAESAARRLLHFSFFAELPELARKVQHGTDYSLPLRDLVRGLNFLVTGFGSANEGLIVPDPSCLFARDPGAFRRARPSLIHSIVDVTNLGLTVPDQGFVREVLDIDDIEVQLVVSIDGQATHALMLRPRLYEAIRQAATFQGPAGHGVAEMAELRAFYGELATALVPDHRLRVADASVRPPVLRTVNLPW